MSITSNYTQTGYVPTSTSNVPSASNASNASCGSGVTSSSSVTGTSGVATRTSMTYTASAPQTQMTATGPMSTNVNSSPSVNDMVIEHTDPKIGTYYEVYDPKYNRYWYSITPNPSSSEMYDTLNALRWAVQQQNVFSGPSILGTPTSDVGVSQDPPSSMGTDINEEYENEFQIMEEMEVYSAMINLWGTGADAVEKLVKEKIGAGLIPKSIGILLSAASVKKDIATVFDKTKSFDEQCQAFFRVCNAGLSCAGWTGFCLSIFIDRGLDKVEMNMKDGGKANLERLLLLQQKVHEGGHYIVMQNPF